MTKLKGKEFIDKNYNPEHEYGGISRVTLYLSLDSYELMRFANKAREKEITLDRYFDLMMKMANDSTS